MRERKKERAPGMILTMTVTVMMSDGTEKKLASHPKKIIYISYVSRTKARRATNRRATMSLLAFA